MQSNREVASGVVNLGNTCYMNAVLQALAHAPELCMAIDLEPHSASCPIASQNDTNNSFCILCELEKHLQRVHKSSGGNGTSTSEAVTPTDFVNGFVKHIAPGFKLGVQEDSHEFLRLLIDAMQNSSKTACTMTIKEEEDQDEAGANGNQKKESNQYSYRLFCGKVESTVKCSNCDVVSSKIDPIEDIGLEVIPSSSRSSSPTPSSLVDVTAALEKFVATERLDSGYKCESCGKIGQATKATRLASIPPLLTLHLKRFRYGNEKMALAAGAPSRRRNSELSSLSAGGDVGTSGSAKIEGHVKFIEVFDIKPYLTEEMKKVTKAMLCRLFAVVVHTGKNSHSGHYICYVRNLAKNEWWKMDDARVTRVSKEDVMAAEAYMLFYNVVNHPVSDELKKSHRAMTVVDSKPLQTIKAESISEEKKIDSVVETMSGTKRKREGPSFRSGEDWARKMTTRPKLLLKSIRAVQEYFSSLVRLKPEYVQSMKEEIESGAKAGSGPSFGISGDDVENKDSIESGIVKIIKTILPKDHRERKALFREQNGSSKTEKSSCIEPNESQGQSSSHNLIIPIQNQTDNLI